MKQHGIHISMGTKEEDVDNSQGDEREPTLDKLSLAEPPGAMTREQVFAWVFACRTQSLVSNPMLRFPLFLCEYA